VVLGFSNRPITPLATVSDMPKLGTGPNVKKKKKKIQINRYITIIVWRNIFEYNILGVNNTDIRLIKFSNMQENS
jgi:hypothetical protein